MGSLSVCVVCVCGQVLCKLCLPSSYICIFVSLCIWAFRGAHALHWEKKKTLWMCDSTCFFQNWEHRKCLILIILRFLHLLFSSFYLPPSSLFLQISFLKSPWSPGWTLWYLFGFADIAEKAVARYRTMVNQAAADVMAEVRHSCLSSVWHALYLSFVERRHFLMFKPTSSSALKLAVHVYQQSRVCEQVFWILYQWEFPMSSLGC